MVGKARIKITVKHMGNTKGTSNSIENHPNEQKWQVSESTGPRQYYWSVVKEKAARKPMSK